MTFDDILKAGRAMSVEEQTACVRSLAADTRFAAVIGILDSLREESVDWQTDPRNSIQHGPLAYGAGALGAVKKVNDVLRGIIDAPAAPPPLSAHTYG